jgi:hypothetical protein
MEVDMIELVHKYQSLVADTAGRLYVACAFAAPQPDGLWQGWFAFFPVQVGEVLTTDRETTQSKLTDIEYWASGIEAIYLEGALSRALQNRPSMRLERRIAQAERAREFAAAEAEAYERAADAARTMARLAESDRREQRRLLGELDQNAPPSR